MDLAKEFEEYLPRWSEEKHQPIPTKQHMERWYQAWDDFVKEELAPRWESLRNEYKSLKLKGMDEEVEEVTEEEPEEVVEEVNHVEEIRNDENLTEWEKVQKLMDDMNKF